MSAEAWAMFLKGTGQVNGTWPLKSAWRDVRDVVPAKGWDWPSFITVWRAWQGLTETERLTARLGPEEAAKRLAIPALRDKGTIAPLDWVSLDGRTLDFWVDFGDGRAVRPVMLALVDVASNCILGYDLAQTENAAATVRLIRRTCARFGIFDRLYTDNGSAFAGHLAAGGAVHKFRRTGSGAETVKPLGICHHLGIELRFALPGNAQAKIAERAFATLSRVLDDRPEFAGAHAGHAPGAAPGPDVVPVPLDLVQAVIAREIARHNAEPGRRGQGMAGRSYQAAFEAGLEGRTLRKPTARQLYLAGLIYKPASVDRCGRVTIDG
jgi:putative transposase